MIEGSIRNTGFAPERLFIEITESAALVDVTETVKVIAELARLGIGIALDDFGTGFKGYPSNCRSQVMLTLATGGLCGQKLSAALLQGGNLNTSLLQYPLGESGKRDRNLAVPMRI